MNPSVPYDANSARMNAPSPSAAPIRVAALYRFTRFEDCPAIVAALDAAARAHGVYGTLLVAPEGINGTIAGSDAVIDAMLGAIRDLPGCTAIEIKESRAAELPFHRMKVRLKREIVTMGEPGIDPSAGVGDYVAPADWNALISDPDTIVIDTRNAYEVAIGSFAGAIDPRTASFREFPEWFRGKMRALADAGRSPNVAMFCTGGIRCEKATALARSEGIDRVYHLQGGILNYLETVPQDASLWRGECFVFDERVAVGHGLVEGQHVLCRGCRMPVSQADRASLLFEEGVACPACHDARDARQRAGYAERQRQEALAAERGERHVGARFATPTEGGGITRSA